MALSSKLEALARMTDAFKTALYDQHVGREARYVQCTARDAGSVLRWKCAHGMPDSCNPHYHRMFQTSCMYACNRVLRILLSLTSRCTCTIGMLKAKYANVVCIFICVLCSACHCW